MDWYDAVVCVASTNNLWIEHRFSDNRANWSGKLDDPYLIHVDSVECVTFQKSWLLGLKTLFKKVCRVAVKSKVYSSVLHLSFSTQQQSLFISVMFASS